MVRGLGASVPSASSCFITATHRETCYGVLTGVLLQLAEMPCLPFYLGVFKTQALVTLRWSGSPTSITLSAMAFQ
jgi:hypothetical protein